MKKYFLWGATAAVLFASLPVVADNVSSALCATYLSISDAQFNALVSTDKNKATTMANSLASCYSSNACSDISMDSCAAVLATRHFIGKYFANFNWGSQFSSAPQASAASILMQSPSPSSPASPPSATFANPPTTTPAIPVAPVDNADKQDSANNIHWF